MALLDLLKEPTLYDLSSSGKPGSKGLKDPRPWRDGGPLLGRRVSWSSSGVNIDNPNELLANPNFEHGFPHVKGGLIDSIVRGGISTAEDRRSLDAKRITNFLLTPNGIQFLATQVALQSQNPRKNQRVYNAGINTIQSVATAGLSNVKRQGLLSLGGFDVAEALGARVDYITDEEFDAPIVGSTETIGGRLREINYNLGDPGKITEEKGLNKIISGINNPFADNTKNYNVRMDAAIDKLNNLPIIKKSVDDDFSTIENHSKDLVKFKFEVINHDDNTANNILSFRAYLENINDNYNANHNEFKYNGRGEPFYIYNKFGRKISVNFKIAAQTRWEMKPLYQKLNYLAAQTAPNYSEKGRIRTPYLYLTIGNWFSRIPGLITSVGLSWQKNYPWEIKADTGETGLDNDMKILPHVLDVSVNFQPIHSFTPQNAPNAPFIGIGDWARGAYSVNEYLLENNLKEMGPSNE